MKRVRIATLITDLDVGGAERNLATLATGLDPGRFDVHVASLMPPGAMAEPIRSAGIPLVDIHMTQSADLRALPRVSTWLRRTKPDLLHTWLFHANLLGRLAAAAAGVRCVVSSIRVAEPRRWHLRLERWTSCLADCILTNSESLRAFMVDRGIDPARLRVIPNAVDLERFSGRRKPKRGHGPVTLLFVGRLTEQKGVDVLLHALAEVSSRLRVKLKLAGDGPDRGRLESMARELNLSNVSFLGQTDDVPALLADSDVFVLPSRWEGLPNVVLEAMAARCPVIGTDVTGTRDLIRDGENGLLVEVDAPKALAAAIERLAGDPVLRKSLATKGRKTAAQHSTHQMIARHETLYQEMLSRDARHR